MYYFNFYSDYIEDRKENKKQRLNLVHPTLINRSFKIQNRENENEEMIKGRTSQKIKVFRLKGPIQAQKNPFFERYVSKLFIMKFQRSRTKRTLKASYK